MPRLTYKYVNEYVDTLNDRYSLEFINHNNCKFALDSAYNNYRLIITADRGIVVEDLTGFATLREVFKVINGMVSISNLYSNNRLKFKEDGTLTR